MHTERRKTKDQAIVLRSSGKSYQEIANTTGVPKSTLSYWFGRHEWPKSVIEKNAELRMVARRSAIMKINQARTTLLSTKYSQARAEAEEYFLKNKADPLFIAGIMLYAGEGDKSMKSNLVRISNAEARLLRIFKLFIDKHCFVRSEKMHFWALVYPDNNIDECEKYWEKEVGVPRKQFYKSQRTEGRHKTKKLIYGVGNIIIGDKVLKVRILEWIRLASEKLCENAGMVQW